MRLGLSFSDFPTVLPGDLPRSSHGDRSIGAGDPLVITGRSEVFGVGVEDNGGYQDDNRLCELLPVSG